MIPHEVILKTWFAVCEILQECILNVTRSDLRVEEERLPGTPTWSCPDDYRHGRAGDTNGDPATKSVLVYLLSSLVRHESRTGERLTCEQSL